MFLTQIERKYFLDNKNKSYSHRILRVMNTFEHNNKESSNFKSKEAIVKLTDRIIT